MKDIRIIIGANYGDEGKGLATNFFAHQAKEQNKKSVVVLHNGGFQRGHTVIHDNIRHVFHCFSAGTFQNAVTYYAPTFILNPMFFREEYEKLTEYGYEPKVMINPNCRITTPYDVMVNQIIEEYRGNDRHGSCGYGVWETTQRHKEIPFIIQDIVRTKNSEDFIASILFEIRENYTFSRLEQYGLTSIPIKRVKEILDNRIIAKYIEDLNFMMSHVEIQETVILDSFDSIIFEGCQGLLLDQDNKTKKEHLTPSNTNLTNPAKIIKDLQMLGFLQEANIETHYITRTYLTRHGAGEFPQECNKEEINKEMFDVTNIHNDFQGTIRYGYIDVAELQERIAEDSKKLSAPYYLFVTHLNETNNCFYTNGKLIPVKSIKNIKYISDKETVVKEA